DALPISLQLVGFAIVQVGAGTQVYVVVLNRLVEVLQDRGIRPRLVRRVRDFAYTAAYERRHHTVLLGSVGHVPLLELDDDRRLAPSWCRPLARRHEVDALR